MFDFGFSELAVVAVIGLWLALLWVDFPVLLALVAFVCHFIPNIGAGLASAPAMRFSTRRAAAPLIGTRSPVVRLSRPQCRLIGAWLPAT